MSRLLHNIWFNEKQNMVQSKRIFERFIGNYLKFYHILISNPSAFILQLIRKVRNSIVEHLSRSYGDD
jgi:hypothetical protein